MGELRDLCRADRVDLFETTGVQQTFDGGGGEEFSSFRGQLVQGPMVKAHLEHLKVALTESAQRCQRGGEGSFPRGLCGSF